MLFVPFSSTRLRAAGILAAGALIAACSGSARDQRGTGKTAATSATTPGACRATVDDAVGLAVTDYVKAAKPKPERFLVAAGTDSALGDAGLTALQDKGPTYLFPGDPALQATVRSQLHEKGDYTTLLVVRRGAIAQGGMATVLLAGHYIGGETDGQHAATRSFTFACDTAGWHLKTSAEQQST
jgi:hypothetical protein